MSRRTCVAVFNDHADTVEMLVQVLRHAGMEACGATMTARTFDLRKFMDRHEPGVIVYDVKVPYERSIERFRRFRSESFGSLPVFLTTTDGNLLKNWLHEGEVRAVFLKPCDVRALIEAIRGVLPE